MKPPSSPRVVAIGSGGGPQESNTTAFLVRSIAQAWRKGSVVAVDAGVHLSAITRILRESQPSSSPSSSVPSSSNPLTLTSGPFAGLSVPHCSPDANAGYITSSLIEAYLITHPHLDHISGFVVNTAGPPGARPKKLAGLPGTIHAFKTHIFNNVIWPNLSDENNGAGLVTYLRLVEGGSPALGDGEGKGYSEICDGLLVKIWGVSHGHCIERHSHRGSASSASGLFSSQDAVAAAAGNQASQTPRRDPFHAHQTLPATTTPTPRRQSLLSQATTFGSSSVPGPGPGSPHAQAGEQERFCVYDSSAYFIQEQDHRREVLIFGDVEPDSLSLSPRNLLIWREAAPKIVAGNLAAIFIECSYDDARENDRLFGHLKPVFVIEELCALAAEVQAVRRALDAQQQNHAAPFSSSSSSLRKRKRPSGGGSDVSRRPAPRQPPPPPVAAASGDGHPEDPVSPKTSSGPSAADHDDDNAIQNRAEEAWAPRHELSLRDAAEGSGPTSPEQQQQQQQQQQQRQLEGLKVVIIHVKDTLSDDDDAGETILRELQKHEDEAQLGCEFIMARSGQSFYL
ncbi:3',5'-cyclic-nucleotide phosphodiesterase-like protein [Hapsidospora chrysogenum ATCC 11550]|uniref:3',5'-cyclic-nucleotide phosphodiesterase-like protein n=1 Tax=Hapsidospora chrysogenum (strain ATCC 11550 / CBS 779.69 / DSM 880 / IAM 14645 / JCM 23072 / IMI 49137) TaxID=857340 RepID=A0A086TI75_HAPC1|nr:3',5'-cyclic-nucleotide phosphodiesterase-like protein [Hapsidospora chrysogenum ATCC 11550]